MKLSTAFEQKPRQTTTTVIVLYIALIILGMVALTSCSVLKREGSTSPCYLKKHQVL